MKRPALQNEQFVVLRMAFRARKVFGTFEKRAPGRLREESQGLLLSFLTFLRPIFLLARLAFFPPPLTAPGSPRMYTAIQGYTGT